MSICLEIASKESCFAFITSRGSISSPVKMSSFSGFISSIIEPTGVVTSLTEESLLAKSEEFLLLKVN